MENEMSKEMDEFIDKIDSLCWEYGYEIWTTDKKKCGKRRWDLSNFNYTRKRW